ncbi:grasp-with-spasm system SPASM domain peptide maturase [Larkinella sp. GY13]|uniref:grasp-with-spasm system SPASM domain peptide maturase n=1 Tax=Larkinella sp. GY13 TaxID=3453720 RepID=UPI003EEADCFD
MVDQYFRLYACCLLIKGSRRSLINDGQRNIFYFIPNSLYLILVNDKNKSYEEILAKYDEKDHITICEYFTFLHQNELLFWCKKEELELFPDIELRWESPAVITNAIIDINGQSYYDFCSLFQELEQLGCKYIQVRCYTLKLLKFFEDVLCELEDRRILSIELIIKSSSEIDINNLINLVRRFPRIQNIIIHSAESNVVLKEYKLSWVKQTVTDHSHCGLISPNYFSTNLNTFTESQKHNTCLNRKISIDVNGEIKNCPSMTKSYGNIRDTTLLEAINKPGFKDNWFIHKDQIEVCKDCEFRHICTDCRAYIQDPANIYSKPAKCSYDPYTATWGTENPTHNPLHGQ